MRKHGVVVAAALPALLVLAGCSVKANPDFCVAAGDDCGPNRACNPATNQCEAQRPRCSDAMPCELSEFPFCGSDGLCQECFNAARPDDVCSADTPACLSDGACGCDDASQCADVSGKTACDLIGRTCVECADHPDCDSKACKLDVHECVAVADVIAVDPVNGDDAECPTTATPCKTINAALLLVDETRSTIVLASGIYPESVTFTGTSLPGPVTLIGPVVGEPAIIDPSNANVPGLLVERGAQVSIDSVTASGATGAPGGDGLQCDDNGGGRPALTLSRVNFTANADIGLDVSECDITVRRSRISFNTNGGVDLDGDASFVIENNFIYQNGNAGSAIGGVRLFSEQAPQVFNFNTVVFNTAQAVGDQASGLRCVSVVTGAGNIFHGGSGAPSLSTGCEMTFSHIFLPNDMQPEGTGNVNVRDLMFAGAEDFHLPPGSGLQDVEGFTPDKVTAGVTVDIDGDLRPQGEFLDIGADEVVE